MQSNEELKSQDPIITSVYGSGNWPSYGPQKAPIHNDQQYVSNSKTVLSQNKATRKKNAQDFIQGSNNPLKGVGVKQAVSMWNDQREAMEAATEKLDQLIGTYQSTARELGVGREEFTRSKMVQKSILDQLFNDKFGFVFSGARAGIIQNQLASEGIKIDDSLTNRKLEELMVLDDWQSIAATLVPMLIKHGPQAISWIWQKVKPRLNKFMQSRTLPGHDEGLWVGDYNGNNVGKPSKVSSMPGVTTLGPGYQAVDFDSGFKINAVNNKYVASWICPSRFFQRKTTSYPIKTALATGATEFSLTTDVNGNTFFYINPQNPNASTPQSSATFFASYNPTAFNPQDGSYSSSTRMAGPLTDTTVEQFQCIAMQIRVTPTASVNQASGSYYLTYLQNQFFAAAPILGRPSLLTSSNLQTGNSQTDYRGIRLSRAYGTLKPLTSTSSFENGFYGLITGAQPSATVAQVTIYYTYMVIPDTAAYSIMPQDFAPPGVRTQDCISAALGMLPALQMLTYPDSFKLASRVRDCKPTYQGVLAVIYQFMQGYTPPKATLAFSYDGGIGQANPLYQNPQSSPTF